MTADDELSDLEAAEDGSALFGVGEVRAATRRGRVADAFAALVTAGRAAGTLVAEDAALIEGVAVLAAALDTADRVGGMKGGYLASATFPAYQRGLHALRLPVELTAVSQPAPAAQDGPGTTPDWLSEHFGTAE